MMYSIDSLKVYIKDNMSCTFISNRTYLTCLSIPPEILSKIQRISVTAFRDDSSLLFFFQNNVIFTKLDD